MTKDELAQLGQIVLDNIGSFSDTLKEYIDTKDNALKSIIDTEVIEAKKDILGKLAINSEDLNALKSLLDSIDGDEDSEINLKKTFLNLVGEVNTNTQKIDVIGEFMDNLGKAVDDAKSKFALVDDSSNDDDTSDDSSNDDDTSDDSSNDDDTSDDSSNDDDNAL